MTTEKSGWTGRIMLIVTTAIVGLVIAGAIALVVNSRRAGDQPPKPIPAMVRPDAVTPGQAQPPVIPMPTMAPPTAPDPMPFVHMPGGKGFDSTACRTCNTFGFITTDETGQTTTGTRQYIGQQPDGTPVYTQPSPYVLRGNGDNQLNLSQGQDDQGVFSMYAWYLGVGVGVKQAIVSLNTRGNLPATFDCHVEPAPPGSPAGAATMVWFKVHPDQEVLESAWFAAIAPQSPTPKDDTK